jgi:PleD family two-component response regulator
VDRLSKWTLGEYRIRAKGSTVKLTVDAAIGVTAFHKGDDLKSLVARADAAMYEDKKRNRKKAGPAR